jgi:hypothetical protein
MKEKDKNEMIIFHFQPKDHVPYNLSSFVEKISAKVIAYIVRS